MPSATRFSFLPAMVAGSAAVGGILGAFVAVGLVATPPAPPSGAQADAKADSQADSQASAPAAQPSQPHAKAPPLVPQARAAETTGSATSEQAAAADCDRETWPYLSRPCMEEWQRKNRNVRVISTDKLDQPTVEAIQNPGGRAADGRDAPAPAIAAAPTDAPLPVATSAPWFDPDAPVATATSAVASRVGPSDKNGHAAQAGNEQAKVKTAAGAETRNTKDNEEANDDGKSKSGSKHASSRSKRKVKPARIDSDDDRSAEAVARTDDDNARAERPRQRRHADRSYRDRDYQIDEAAPGDARHRVVVIRRGGGLFGGLFGMAPAAPDEYDGQ